MLLAPVAAIVAGALNRRRVTRTIEREYAERFPVDAEGIAEGAQGFVLVGTTGRALLLLHGSGDTPQSLRYLGERLNAAGYTVHAPLLPGHGRSPRAFATATADDYYRASCRAYDKLSAKHEWVALVGLSMGGALAARIAVDRSGVRALALLAPYLSAPPGVRWALGSSWLWGMTAPYLRGRGEDSVHDVTVRSASRAYGTFSAGALQALVDTAAAGRDAVAKLAVPTLVVNSEQDNRIPRALAMRALAAMPASTEQHWIAGCGHVITVDYCKDAVAELVLSFLARHAG